MRKTIIIIGVIGVLYLFVSIILPNLIGIPLAAYQSYKNFQESSVPEHSSYRSTVPISDIVFKFTKPIGYVNDFENIFTSEQRIKLDKRIGVYELETTNEIVIVTIDSIEPYENINDFATDLSNEWGIGKTEKNNGLLILFSKSLREIRISTGLGTEKILTDEICKKVIDQTIIPEFKKGNYYNGIEKGLTELIAKWK